MMAPDLWPGTLDITPRRILVPTVSSALMQARLWIKWVRSAGAIAALLPGVLVLSSNLREQSRQLAAIQGVSDKIDA